VPPIAIASDSDPVNIKAPTATLIVARYVSPGGDDGIYESAENTTARADKALTAFNGSETGI
jgi:hypothetical protein